jgi:pimeloyl-ACP methyl ester carboxylesterase
MSLMMLLTLAVVRFLAMFVDEEAYTAKIAALPSMEQKHAGEDLGAWEYRGMPAANGNYRHRYYYCPSQVPDAPVFLMIHGLNLDGRTFRYFTPLAADCQLIAYDLPEQCPLYQGAYDNWRAIIDDFVAQIPDSIAGVGGVSFGGGIALHLAANNPRLRGRRLVLIATTMINETAEMRANTHRMAQWVRRIPDYKIYWFIETMIARNERSLADEALPGRDVRDVLSMKHPAFYRQTAVSLDGYRAAEDAARVAGPALMLIGDKDDLYDKNQRELMMRFIPHIEYEVIAGGTHSMAYLRGEELCERIIEFCRP